MSNASIWVTFEKEGIHQYKEAGTNPNLADVSFLQYPHRHIFHFKVTIDVTHDNRDIEFIQFKRYCMSLYDDNILQLDNSSCEMIATSLGKHLAERYHRNVTVDVSEDGENGATVFISAEDCR